MIKRRDLRRLLLALCSLLGVPLYSGCERRAPSPDECVQFAELRYGIRLEDIVQLPPAKADFDQLVSLCLLVPMDRRVIECAKARQQPLDCLRSIQPDLYADRQFDFALRPSWRLKRF